MHRQNRPLHYRPININLRGLFERSERLRLFKYCFSYKLTGKDNYRAGIYQVSFMVVP